MSFEFGMRPQGQLTEAAEPEEYDVDEAEADEVAPSDSANLGAALSETNVLEVLDQLDRDLIALLAVETRFREIAALLLIDKLRSEVGLSSERPSLHMSFTGNPGTRSKTTVAMKMARRSPPAREATSARSTGRCLHPRNDLVAPVPHRGIRHRRRRRCSAAPTAA